jgi:hypothetical protein
MMLDDRLPDLGIMKTYLLTLFLAIALQFTGIWIMMIIAGAIGGLLLKRQRSAFLVGFVSVASAWLVLYAIMTLIGNAMLVAEFFVGLLGLSGLGWLIIAIGCVLGGLLGGFGAVLSRATIELIDDMACEDPELTR